MSRGFVAIGLHRPKTPVNVGGVLRAASCFNADLIVVGGYRRPEQSYFPTDTTKAWKTIPTLMVDHVLDSIPIGAEPVAVDLVPNAKPLPNFIHPDRAYYIFGPEDGTLGDDILAKCRYRVMIPSRHCLNLAACANVILYDRAAKLSARTAPP